MHARLWTLLIFLAPWASGCDVLAPGDGRVAFVEVATGEFHACALGETGRAYCWGAAYDALGLPTLVSGSDRLQDLTVTRVNGAGVKDYAPDENASIVHAGAWAVSRARSAPSSRLTAGA